MNLKIIIVWKEAKQKKYILHHYVNTRGLLHKFVHGLGLADLALIGANRGWAGWGERLQVIG